VLGWKKTNDGGGRWKDVIYGLEIVGITDRVNGALKLTLSMGGEEKGKISKNPVTSRSFLEKLIRDYSKLGGEVSGGVVRGTWDVWATEREKEGGGREDFSYEVVDERGRGTLHEAGPQNIKPFGSKRKIEGG